MKKLLWSAFICALALTPATLFAQAETGSMPETMAPAAKGAVAPAKVYGELYKNVSEEIINAAEAMPADKYGFSPTAGNFTGVRTFGGQVSHLIAANYGFFRGFGMPIPVTRAQIADMKTKDQLVQGLKDSFAFTDKAIATITPENAFLQIGTGEEVTTRAGAATFCLAHANDHYGQMVEYLRMNGIVPPASVKK
jgi:uncharacterized damage-inducible protein DinB